MRKNEHGFSAVGVFVSVVVIGLIGAAGWLVYDRQSKSETKNSQKNETQQTQSNQNSENKDEEIKEDTSTMTTTHYVNGVSLELPNSMGSLLAWSRSAEASNLSSSTLLDKEKELYGDSTLNCKANDYALGSITVKDESNPFPGETLVKKLGSGKYLFYADSAEDSFCFKKREQLQGLIKEQVKYLKDALKTAR